MKGFDSFFKTTTHRKYNTWCKYTTRLDTYGCGCSHECKYCYAKSLLDFRNNWNSDQPKPAFITEVIKTINTLSAGDFVRMGGMSDCFQPIERIFRVTRQAIERLNSIGVHYLIVTKSDLVASDEYMQIYDKNLAHFQISITNTDDYKCFEYEKASLVSDRIKAVERLSDAGFDVSVRLSPLIEGFVDFSIINKIRCRKILVEFLKVNHWVKKRFNIDYSRHTLSYGGYQNLQLEDKVRMVDMVDFEQVTVGEYVNDHYAYFRDNVNYNKFDCCNLDAHHSKFSNSVHQCDLFAN